jgi:predicted nucleotidyltransferase component of viral defense system
MLHDDKGEFVRMLERTSAQTGFPQVLLEKDYYLSLLLSRINDLSDALLFKGGTCLSKVHFSYYRLSEDLDFTMMLPKGRITRAERRNTFKPVKENMRSFAKISGMTIEDDATGHSESSQYIYYAHYDSALLGDKQSVKFEIGLRFNPLMPIEKKKVYHKFLHPFTKEPLFDGGTVNCLNLKELVSEKMRAASTRQTIAPRDFYDLGYLLKAGFDFKDAELLRLFKAKLAEDGFDTDLQKYRHNLGRSNKEVEDMFSRVESELLDVLTYDERSKFSMADTLQSLNAAFHDLQ